MSSRLQLLKSMKSSQIDQKTVFTQNPNYMQK